MIPAGTNEKRNIRLRIAYDGTDFSGWQRQDGRRTVQGVLENALEKMHHHPVPLTGAGRTDAGVHAAGQMANFYTDIARIEPERFVPALNGFLAPDLRILESHAVDPGFHARFDARSRTYQYHLIGGRDPLPHEGRYAHHLRHVPRIDILNSYARLLHGEMDCTLFAAARDPSRSRFRYINNAYFFIDRDILVFEITANAFLWNMVRSIVGTLLFYEERQCSTSHFADILTAGFRSDAGPTLPPTGLFLWNVAYPTRGQTSSIFF
ncbi:tRNA pseudouridine synthase A [Spirochaetia bacterium]|nr:tRNA pseudouridine synthase A [Spirochaetia bacterium]